MFVLENFCAFDNKRPAMTSNSKKIIVVVKSSSDETASTISSLSSDSTKRRDKDSSYRSQAKHVHKKEHQQGQGARAMLFLPMTTMMKNRQKEVMSLPMLHFRY